MAVNPLYLLLNHITAERDADRAGGSPSAVYQEGLQWAIDKAVQMLREQDEALSLAACTDRVHSWSPEVNVGHDDARCRCGEWRWKEYVAYLVAYEAQRGD